MTSAMSETTGAQSGASSVAGSVTAKMRRTRVLVHGLVYFGSVFADFMNCQGWDFRYYPDSGLRNLAPMLRHLAAADLVYQLGGRLSQGKFLKAARALGKSKIVMHWLGSDTLDEFRVSGWDNADPWVLHTIEHWAESEWIAEEVRLLGASCKVVPFPSPRIPATPSPLPAEFRVLVYMPTLERSALYGFDQILAVARDLPDVPFELVGLLDGPLLDLPPNLRAHGRISDLREFYMKSTVVWRPARHDGVSWMVLEALGHGRHVLWSYPFPGCTHVASASHAREQIARLNMLHTAGRLAPNDLGAEFIERSGYQPEAMRRTTCARFKEVLAS